MEIHNPENSIAAAARKRSGSLFRRTGLMIAGLVSGILIVAGAAEIYFSYQETRMALAIAKHERARAAAASIEGFFRETETQISWALHAAILDPISATRQRKIDFLRLLRQAPEITDLMYIEADGREQLRISRVSVDRAELANDHSGKTLFRLARLNGRHYGPIYFRRESEPFLTLALKDVAGGVTVAEVNLRFVYDVIERVETGRGGRVFVVDSTGLLVAHPDPSLVLQKTNLTAWPHVTAALNGVTDARGQVAEFADGTQFLSSHAQVSNLGWFVFVEVPLSVAFVPLISSLIRTGVLVGVGIVLSLLASFFLARRIARPIRALQTGAERIGAGELDHRINVTTGDELQALAESFNRMGELLNTSQEKVKRISALKRYFSPQLAETILSSGRIDMRTSRRREITVIFCDIRGFTEFTATAEPEEVMRVLEEFYILLGKHLTAYEATVGYFAGDGIMAYFNDPVPRPEHARDAVKMSIAMRADLSTLVESWHKRGLRLGVGIGIATGYATLGTIGTEDHFHFTAVGSVVNLAARLCELAADGEVLISGPVYAEAEAVAYAEEAGEVRLKGFPKPVPVLKLGGLHRPNIELVGVRK